MSIHGSVININGGTITTSSILITAQGGTVNMKGGSITASGDECAVYGGSGTFNMSGGTINHNSGETVTLAIHGGSVNITGGSITSNSNIIRVYDDVTFSLKITGTSTILKGTGTNNPTILCNAGASGTITIGEISSSSSTYPYISHVTSGFGISNSSSNVKVNKYSGKVD